MLVRFSNAGGCETCTQTVDFTTLRAIGMFLKDANNSNSYFVRISFMNGDTYLARQNMSYEQAVNYRNLLEGYWEPCSSFGVEAARPNIIDA